MSDMLSDDKLSEQHDLEQTIQDAMDFTPQSLSLDTRTPILLEDKRQLGGAAYYGYVYVVKNMKTGKQYVGQHSHPMFDDSYWGSGRAIKKAIALHGTSCFSIKVIDWAKTKKELNNKEIYWIDTLGTYKWGYNMTTGGDGGDTYSALPPLQLEEIKEKIKKSMTPERRKQLSEQAKARTGEKNGNYGKKLTEEQKQKLRGPRPSIAKENHPRWGEHCSEETKRKISLANTGRKASLEEILHKKASSWKSRGARHPFEGHKHSEKTKKLLSEKLSGENHPCYGRKLTEEHKQRLREANIGKKHSESSKQKISAAVQGAKHPNAIPIVQLTLDGTFVREYSYAGEVQQFGFSRSHISSCCTGKSKSYKNYLWIYKSVWEGQK